jgi:hypothetical protein
LIVGHGMHQGKNVGEILTVTLPKRQLL